MSPAPPPPSPPRDDDAPPSRPFDDDALPLPLPPADGDDEAPGGPELPLPFDAPRDDGGEGDDGLANELPVGRLVDDLEPAAPGDDSALGLGVDADDPLGDDGPPPTADESEGFEGDEGGLPDDAPGFDDDGGEGPGGGADELTVGPLPALDPDGDDEGPGRDEGVPLPAPPEGAAAARPWRSAGRCSLPFAAHALATFDAGALAVAGPGLALFGGPPPPVPRAVTYPFDEGAPAVAACADPWRPGSLVLIDRRLDVHAFDASRALASPRPPLPAPPLGGPGGPTLWRLAGPRLVAWHPSGLTLALDAAGHWSRFYHVPFVAFATDGAGASAGLAESIEGRPRLHASGDGGATWGARDVPAGLGPAPAGAAPSPWLLGCYEGLVLLGRPGRGLWVSPAGGDWRRVAGGDGALALAPPGAGPLALVAEGGRVALARVGAAGDLERLADVPAAFGATGVLFAWDAAAARLWLACGPALAAFEPAGPAPERPPGPADGGRGLRSGGQGPSR
jgi:hypothetical protein